MVISGRVPLLLLLGVVAVVLRPSGGTVALWLLAVALLVGADLLLAPVDRRRSACTGGRRARCGSATPPSRR